MQKTFELYKRDVNSELRSFTMKGNSENLSYLGQTENGIIAFYNS